VYARKSIKQARRESGCDLRAWHLVWESSGGRPPAHQAVVFVSYVMALAYRRTYDEASLRQPGSVFVNSGHKVFFGRDPIQCCCLHLSRTPSAEVVGRWTIPRERRCGAAAAGRLVGGATASRWQGRGSACLAAPEIDKRAARRPRQPGTRLTGASSHYGSEDEPSRWMVLRSVPGVRP
jgi:hypothetical protein